MKPLLFLIGSIGGFLALSRRYRRRPATRNMTARLDGDTPITVGDGSLWVSSPGIDDASVWERRERELRSPKAEANLVGAQVLVNGTAIPVPCTPAGEAVITVIYNGAATLTIAALESDDGHVHIMWNEPYGSGFVSGGRWHPGSGRWTFDESCKNERITRILVDGALWYRARDFDKPGKRAYCQLQLRYVFGCMQQ